MGNTDNLENESNESWYKICRPRNIDEYSNDGEISKIVNARFTDKSKRPSVFMIQGPTGCGKTTLYRMIIPYYLCESPTPDGKPCGKCDMCKLIEENIISGNSDIEIDGVKEVNGSKFNTRADLEPVLEEMSEPSYTQEYKILILDECQKITKGVQNLMLKTLEDIPKHLVVILATTDPQDIIDPIKSRCQLTIEVKRQTIDSMTETLRRVCEKMKVTASIEALQLISKKGLCMPRKAINLLESVAKTYDYVVDVENVKDYTHDDDWKLYLEYLEASKKSLARINLFVYNLKQKSISPQIFIKGLIRFVLDCMYIKHGIAVESFNSEMIEAAKNLYSEYTSNEFDMLLQIIEETLVNIKGEIDSSVDELLLTTMALKIGKVDLYSKGLTDTIRDAVEENKESISKYHDRITGDPYEAKNSEREVRVENFKDKYSEIHRVNNSSEVLEQFNSLKQNQNRDKEQVDDGKISAEELEEMLK